MPLRDVKPLDEKQWAQLQAMLKEGPTDESIATVKRALKRTENIKRDF